jgi:hypothetical protein
MLSWNPHLSKDEVASLLIRYSMSNLTLLGLNDRKAEGTVIIRKDYNYLPVDKKHYWKGIDILATQL